MKKTWILILLVLGLTASMVQAIGVSDIPAIVSVTGTLSSDIAALQRFADHLKVLADNNFVVPVADGSETLTVTNQQKLNLLARYQALKAQLLTDFNQLP